MVKMDHRDAIRALELRERGEAPEDHDAAELFYRFWFGGDSEGFGPYDVKPRDVLWGELERGIEHERHHSDDEMVAAKIVLDHLVKNPEYYKRLEAAGL